MKHIFILNPAAGKGKAPQFLVPEIKEFFGEDANYEIHITERKGHATEIARTAAESYEKVRIYACGGEGTCFETVNGIVGYDNVSLGVLPYGSANDFLKFFENKELFFDLAEQVDGVEVPVDLIKANEFYCINQCSVGMDAIVAERMQKFKRLPFVSGSLAYNLAIVKLFLGKIGLKIKIKVDNKIIGLKDCLFAVCANGPIYGGGYNSAPNAIPFDGELDYTIVDTISKLKVLSFLKLYSRGSHLDKDYCSYGRCTSMEIEADKPFPLNLDGEIVLRDKVKFEVVKNAVKFIVPKKIANKLLTNKEFSQNHLIFG